MKDKAWIKKRLKLKEFYQPTFSFCHPGYSVLQTRSVVLSAETICIDNLYRQCFLGLKKKNKRVRLFSWKQRVQLKDMQRQTDPQIQAVLPQWQKPREEYLECFNEHKRRQQGSWNKMVTAIVNKICCRFYSEQPTRLWHKQHRAHTNPGFTGGQMNNQGRIERWG